MSDRQTTDECCFGPGGSPKYPPCNDCPRAKKTTPVAEAQTPDAFDNAQRDWLTVVLMMEPALP